MVGGALDGEGCFRWWGVLKMVGGALDGGGCFRVAGQRSTWKGGDEDFVLMQATAPVQATLYAATRPQGVHT